MHNRPARSLPRWVWFTRTLTIWDDFLIMDDFGTLRRVHFRRMQHSLNT